MPSRWGASMNQSMKWLMPSARVGVDARRDLVRRADDPVAGHRLGERVGLARDEGDGRGIARVVLDVGADLGRQVIGLAAEAPPARRAGRAASPDRGRSGPGSPGSARSRPCPARPPDTPREADRAGVAAPAGGPASCSSPDRSGRRRPARPAPPRRTRGVGGAAAAASARRRRRVTSQVRPRNVTGPSAAQSRRISSVASTRSAMRSSMSSRQGKSVVDVLAPLVAAVEKMDEPAAGELVEGGGHLGGQRRVPEIVRHVDHPELWRGWSPRRARRGPSSPRGSPRLCRASGDRPPRASRSPAPRPASPRARPPADRARRSPGCERAGCRGRRRSAGRRRTGCRSRCNPPA